MTDFATADELVAKCMTSGLVIRKAPTYEITHPPLTLHPLCVSQEVYKFITELQRDWNALVDAVARDFTFLLDALGRCAASDTAFTGRLLEMMKRIYIAAPPGSVQEAMLGIFRTDYMEDAKTREWKNVEVNAISVSFAGLAPRVNEFHQYLAAAEKSERPSAITPILTRGNSDVEVPRALAEAHNYVLSNDYVRMHDDSDQQQRVPVIVFVIQEKERNTGDQYLLSIQLLEAHGVRSVRRTMSQLGETMQLIPGLKPGAPPCAVFDNYVATVFYFRCSYVPTDFVNESCWEAREAMERSSAVKCPSLPHHLVGFKKIQQVLYDAATLRRFTASEDSAVRLSSTFMAQYSLDAEESDASCIQVLIADAMANPHKYVLKPQLEGGGNLVAGQELVKALSLPVSDPKYQRIRREFILMERIAFGSKAGAILRDGMIMSIPGGLCSEMGTFGTILSTGRGAVLFNRTTGTLVRTKPADVDDGGVMAGVAALDSLAMQA
jgi:glutathione synthase